jgi:hypothetical protein
MKKDRHHNKRSDANEKDNKRRTRIIKAITLKQFKNEQSMANAIKTLEKSSKTRIVG